MIILLAAAVLPAAFLLYRVYTMDTIEKGAAQEKQLSEAQKRPIEKRKETPEPARPLPKNSNNEEVRPVSKKVTGVYLFEDQLEKIREIEYRQKKRNLSSETVRKALDEYFRNHNIL